MLLGTHRSSPKPVCGHGAAFPPRARDYKEHSRETQNASEGSKMGAGEFSIAAAWDASINQYFLFYFFKADMSDGSVFNVCPIILSTAEKDN